MDSSESLFSPEKLWGRGNKVVAGCWIICFHPNKHARLRLFCFPSGGAGPSLYRTWGKALPADIEVCVAQLPGREGRIKDPPVYRMSLLVKELADGIQPYLDKPFAFFGHSMGAWVCFELARYCRRENEEQPIHLFVSGRRAPQLPDTSPLLQQLSDSDLVEEIRRRYDGIPKAVLDEPELLKLLLPALRADLAILETYQYAAEPPLACPISCFGGINDSQVSRSDLTSWGHQTTSSFKLQMLPGNHYYLQQSAKDLLLSLIYQELCEHRGLQKSVWA